MFERNNAAIRPVSAPVKANSHPPRAQSEQTIGGKAGEEERPSPQEKRRLHRNHSSNIPGSGRGANELKTPPSRAPRTAPPAPLKKATPQRKIHFDGLFDRDGKPGGGLKKASKLIFTAADCTVKPIVYSNDIENIPAPHVRPEELSFHAMPAEELLSCTTEVLENHFKEIYVSLKSPHASAAEKCGVLGYLFTLCLHSKLANVIVNSSMLMLLTRMVSSLAPSTASRASVANTSLLSMVCLVLGVLFRFATFIAPSSPDQVQALVSTLCQVTRESASDQFASENERTSYQLARYRSLACLGELIFYISTQNDWDFPVSGLTCIVGFLEDQDLILRHYAVRTVCNMLIHCTGSLLRPLVNEQIAASLVRGLMQLPAEGSNKSRTLLRATNTQAIAHLLRHLRTPSSSPHVSSRARMATLLLFSKSNVLEAVWDGVVKEHASCELAIASFNVLNSFLEMRVEREVEANGDLAAVDASKVRLLEWTSSFSVLAKILERRSRYEDATRQENGPRNPRNLRNDDASDRNEHQTRYSEEANGVPNSLRAKAILFIHLGIQLSNNFTSTCIQQRYLDLVDRILMPFASHLRPQNELSEDASSTSSTSQTDVSSPSSPVSHRRNARLSAVDVYMLQCALNLIKLSIRSALKLSADCISSYDGDGATEDRVHSRQTISSAPFELFDLLFRNPMCKGQLVSYFVANEGKEYTFFMRLMAKLLVAFPNEMLSGSGDVKVAVFVSEILLRLFQGTGSEISLLLSVEIDTLFSHLLPAVALQLHRARTEDGDDEEELLANCIRILYMVLLHFQYDTAEGEAHRYHRDVFIKDHLVPCFCALFASSVLNENVWHFGIELLYGLVCRDRQILDEVEISDLTRSIVSLLDTPRRRGFHSVPSSATKLVQMLVDSKKISLNDLYANGIAESLLAGLDIAGTSETLSASVSDLLKILYQLLYDRYEKLRNAGRSAPPPAAPPNFSKLVYCGSLIVNLCATGPRQPHRHQASKSPQPQESPTKAFPAFGAETAKSDNEEHEDDNVADLASRCLVFLSQVREVALASPIDAHVFVFQCLRCVFADIWRQTERGGFCEIQPEWG